MIETGCHSCGAVLPERDGVSLRRCTACGAPQVRLSGELQAQAAAERERYEQDLAKEAAVGAAGAGGFRDRREMQWNKAIGLAAVASGAMVLLCGLVPPLVVAAWWMPAAVLIVYRLRFPQAVLTPLTGARVGAVVGIFSSVIAAAAVTVSLVVRRFGLHRMSGFDALYTGALAAAEKQAMAQNGADAAASFGARSGPEFRAGMLLVFGLLAAIVFVLLCVLCGAVSAAAQRRRVTSSAP